MTHEVKLDVDQNAPGAYGLSSFAEAAGDLTKAEELRQKEISCDSADEKKEIECIAIYHGSGENKSWYICPRIYDILEQRPLRIQDLEFSREFRPRGWKHSEWRIDVSGQDMEQFEPTYKGRGIVRNLVQSDYTQNSLFLLPSKADYFYPGLLDTGSHPKMLSMPCCFKKPNKRLEDLYGIQDPKKAGSVNYVQGWKKTLGWDPPRLGVIPPQMRKHFGVHPIKYKTGMISKLNTDHPLWLRRGIPYGPNPFVECLGNSMDDGTGDINIRHSILTKLTRKTFETFQSGLLTILFSDPTFSMSPFDSYRNHLLFGTNISWETTLDAYSTYIAPKHVWILLDSTQVDEPTILDTSSSSIHHSQLKTLSRL